MNKRLYVKNREEWREWLQENYSKEKEVWLIYYKKHTGKPRIPYDDAVEEALCYGWIDSTVKRIDDETYMQKFTPRNAKSDWSELNKKRVKALIKNGRMAKPGLEIIETAKKNGCWDKVIESTRVFEMPAELEKVLNSNKKIRNFFDSLTTSKKKEYIGWIASAKKEETRERRAEEAKRLLMEKKSLGLK
ncbi:MAG: YdeI/OmpD-associated family protein [Bacteroidetes bacterium]|nr:YdeI/OmpD-associated family protein [Bacteroidota bacterium]